MMATWVGGGGGGAVHILKVAKERVINPSIPIDLPDDAADYPNWICDAPPGASVCGVVIPSLLIWGHPNKPYDHTCYRCDASQSHCKWMEVRRCRRINNFSFCYCYLNHLGSSPNPNHGHAMLLLSRLQRITRSRIQLNHFRILLFLWSYYNIVFLLSWRTGGEDSAWQGQINW